MKALSLWRPWDRAVALGYKTVENRNWPPPRELIGKRFALQGGAKWDESGARFIESMGVRLPSEDAMPGKVLVCSVRLLGYIQREYDHKSPSIRESRTVVGAGLKADFDLALAKAGDWFFGEYGWIFDRVVYFSEPIPCAGRQGLWNLSTAEEQAVLAYEEKWKLQGGLL
jgi:hypothetical protein